MTDLIFTENECVDFTPFEIERLTKLCGGHYVDIEKGNFWCEDFYIEVVKRGEYCVKIIKYDTDSGLSVSCCICDENVDSMLDYVVKNFPTWFSTKCPSLS